MRLTGYKPKTLFALRCDLLRIFFLPFQIFTPETTDIYDRKNLPRVVFCIHALSLFLYQQGVAANPVENLSGEVARID